MFCAALRLLDEHKGNTRGRRIVLKVELSQHHTINCFPRAGCTLHEPSGDGEEHHSGGDAAVLVRRPALLQRLSLGPAEPHRPRRPGDG